MSRLMSAVLVVTLAGIAAIAALFAPGWDPIRFWGSTAWLMVLVAFNWAASAVLIDEASPQRQGAPGSQLGSLPGIGAIVLVYSAGSVAVLFFYNAQVIGSRLHLALQILCIVPAAALILLSLVAARAAAFGSASAVSQNQLLDALRRLQRMSEDPAVQLRIEEQINHVAFRLPHPARLNREALVKALKAIDMAEPSNVERSLKEFETHLRNA